MVLGTHAVKVLQPGHKRWEFITPSGGTNYLRIYAATMDEDRSKRAVADIMSQYPGHQAKSVKL